MQYQKNNRIIQATIVTLIGLAAALLMGQMAGQGDLKMIIAVIGLMGFSMLLISFRQHLWVGIPVCWTLGGKLNVLPINLSIRDTAVVFGFGALVLMYVFKLKRNEHKWIGLDILLGVNLVYVAITFFRNPTGLAFLNSDLVGGRPYFDVFIAVVAYFVLGVTILTPHKSKQIMVWTVAITGFFSVLNMVTIFFPSLTPIIFRFYSGVDVEAYMNQEQGVSAEDGGASPRLGSLGNVGRNGILALCSFLSPSAIINPLRILPFLGTCVFGICILYSGFRTTVMFFVFVMLVATYFRSSAIKLLPIGVSVIALFTILALGNGNYFKLPAPAQRALSFLPGKWDQEAVENAESSSQWRFQIWRRAWNEGYIKNKVLGDGFGFSMQQYEAIQFANLNRGFDDSQLNALITGAYHSGPLSAIRYVGIIGLLLYQSLLVGTAMLAYRTIIAAKGTDYFPISIFVGIPALYESFAYLLIFGQYDSHLPNTIFSIAMLKLVSRGIAEHIRIAARNARTSPETTVSKTPFQITARS